MGPAATPTNIDGTSHPVSCHSQSCVEQRAVKHLISKGDSSLDSPTLAEKNAVKQCWGCCPTHSDALLPTAPLNVDWAASLDA